MAARVRWGLLRNAEDWPGMVAMAAEPDLVGRAPLFGASRQDQATSTAAIELAYARIMAGDLAGAAAILDSTPPDCDRCLMGRGQLAAARGDSTGADRWFANAAAATPSLPQVNFEWDRIKLARGDASGALALFRQAHKLGPRWAEPLKFQGDALMAQAESNRALRAYAQAAEHAPRWGGLHLAWGKALAKAGRAAEAQAQWRSAEGMDLTPTERVELARLQGAK
jgi:tetratricopeptide (TPR) repeat protein